MYENDLVIYHQWRKSWGICSCREPQYHPLQPQFSPTVCLPYYVLTDLIYVHSLNKYLYTLMKAQNRRQKYFSGTPGHILCFSMPFLAPIVLAFYCFIIIYHKISNLKQQPFVIIQFCKSKVQVSPGKTTWTITRLNSRVWLHWVLTEEAWRKSQSRD